MADDTPKKDDQQDGVSGDTCGKAANSSVEEKQNGVEETQASKEQNTEPANAKKDSVKKAVQVKVGKQVTISPVIIAGVRKLERSTSDNIMGNFYALSAGAQQLLPNKPVCLSKEKVKSQEQREGSSENTESGNFKGDDSSANKDAKLEKRKNSSAVEVESKKKREKEDDYYYCDLCDATTNSYQTWETHLQGKKHQKKLAQFSTHPKDRMEMMLAQRYKTEEGPPVRSIVKKGRTPKIQAKIDLVDSPCVVRDISADLCMNQAGEKNNSTCIDTQQGLAYISEIWRLDSTQEILYYCKLCSASCQSNNVISHILGYRHRLCYLKATVPRIYEDVKNRNMKKSDLSRLLEKHAQHLEIIDGRGRMIVEQELDRTPSPEPYERRRFIRGEPFEPFAPQRVSSREPAFPAPFQIEDVRFYPSPVRMDMLKELVDIDPDELQSSMDVSRLEYAIANFKKALCLYRSTTDTHAIESRALLDSDMRLPFAGIGGNLAGYGAAGSLNLDTSVLTGARDVYGRSMVGDYDSGLRAGYVPESRNYREGDRSYREGDRNFREGDRRFSGQESFIGERSYSEMRPFPRDPERVGERPVYDAGRLPPPPPPPPPGPSSDDGPPRSRGSFSPTIRPPPGSWYSYEQKSRRSSENCGGRSGSNDGVWQQPASHNFVSYPMPQGPPFSTPTQKGFWK